MILGSRSESIVSATQSRRTEMIWHGLNGLGAGMESKGQVDEADRSFSKLGKATSSTATAAKLIPMATNSLEDNTGE